MSRSSRKPKREAPKTRLGPISDIAVIKPDDANSLAFAYPDPHGPESSIQIAFADFTEEGIREKLDNIGPLTNRVTLRTVPPLHEAITKTYDQEQIGNYSDAEILDTLIRVAQGNEGSFFSSSLDHIACDFTRLPNNQIAVTELPSQTLDELFSNLTSWIQAGSSSGPVQPGSIVVETALRALLRYHLVTLDFDPSIEYPEAQDTATAILAINASGFAIGLWSPCRGLIRELGEPFRVIEHDHAQGRQLPPSDSVIRANADHAIGRLVGLIRDATNVYRFPNVDSVLLSASGAMSALVSERMTHYANASRKQLIETPVPLEQAVAWGLSLGAEPGSPLPTINLAEDLRSRLQNLEENIEAELVAGKQQRRASAFFMLLLLPALALGLTAGAYTHASVQRNQLAQIHNAEVREEARLKTIQAERHSATQNILWFQTVVSQIIDRRSRQGGIIRLFDDLEARWPTDDPTFYVRELTVKQDGNIEMKGLTKREESVIAFGRSLEFSSGVFQSIAPTINSTPPGLDALPANPMSSAAQAPPGVTAWTLKGVYVPLKSTNATPAALPQTQGGAK